jgi:hypothetical protein
MIQTLKIIFQKNSRIAGVVVLSFLGFAGLVVGSVFLGPMLLILSLPFLSVAILIVGLIFLLPLVIGAAFFVFAIWLGVLVYYILVIKNSCCSCCENDGCNECRSC